MYQIVITWSCIPPYQARNIMMKFLILFVVVAVVSAETFIDAVPQEAVKEAEPNNRYYNDDLPSYYFKLIIVQNFGKWRVKLWNCLLYMMFEAHKLIHNPSSLIRVIITKMLQNVTFY